MLTLLPTLLATLLLSAPAAPADLVVVSLPIEASVDTPEIALGDIATISGEQEAQVKSVMEFGLGYAPSPGYSRVLQRWKIEQGLQRAFPELKFNFEGHAACRVWPQVAKIGGEELELIARDALKKDFAGDDMEIALQRELADEIVPAGRRSRRLEADTANITVRSGTVGVPVKIFIDGEKYRTVWVSLDVTLYRELPVLRRSIPLGGTIQKGDLVLRRTALDASYGREEVTPAMLIGATAKRALPSGRPVARKDVERELAVKQGETVALEVINGQVVVNTKVVALKDGYVGDVVPIRTLSTNKELTALVTESGRMQLRLGSNQNQ